MNHSIILMAGIFSLLLAALRPAVAQVRAPDDAQIKGRIAGMVGGSKKSPGVVVGLIDSSGSSVIAQGKFEAAGEKRVDGETLFEIGSITKVFTAVVLADMAERGELRLDAPIANFLPAEVKTPSRNGKEITLLDLATQSSGLPRLPDNMSPLKLVSSNPYSDYGPEQLYKFLGNYKLERDIGAKYEYSNLGFGLLGHILALKADTNYETLVLNRICAPLQMRSTLITLSPGLEARLAPGHNPSGKKVDNWDFQAMAGAGALRSSVNDMLKFLAASMGTAKTSLNAALTKSQEARRDAGSGRRIGLAWHINTDGTVWHNGGTGGYRSFMGFNRKSNRGVVVLANSAGADTDGLGLFILGPSGMHTIKAIDFSLFDHYIGKYELAPGVIFTVTRDGDHLFAQLTGQSKFEVFPESERDFFYKVVDAQLTFHKDASGKVTHLVLHQNGADQKALRQK